MHSDASCGLPAPQELTPKRRLLNLLKNAKKKAIKSGDADKINKAAKKLADDTEWDALVEVVPRVTPVYIKC